MGNNCTPPGPAEIKIWNENIKYRNVSDSILHKIGNNLIEEWNSGNISTITHENFKKYLHRVEQSHQDLIDFLEFWKETEKKQSPQQNINNREEINKRKQLEDNLKAQNDLIQHLRLQLSECKNEKTKAQEYLQHLEPKYMNELLTVQQQCELKVNLLQKILNERTKQLQELQEQISGVQEPKDKPNQDEDKLNNYCKLLYRIENILESVEFLENDVNNYSGRRDDESFLKLQESLTRYIEKLDTIESEGITDIRKRRKTAIQYIQRLLNKLEGKT